MEITCTVMIQLAPGHLFTFGTSREGTYSGQGGAYSKDVPIEKRTQN